MATDQSLITTPPAQSDDGYEQSETKQSVESGELLDLIGDEYARRVLLTLVDTPQTGRELVDTTDMSKATVYRRLDRLEDAGLVETRQLVDLDGHHRKQFSAVAGAIDVEFVCDGVSASVRVDD